MRTLCRAALRFVLSCCAVFVLLFAPLRAQNLRFASPVYGVKALNGQSAVLTVLSSPAGMAVDAAGNFYIADLGHHLVRKVDPTQTATLFAGTGNAGASGDGGPANFATLTYPNSVAVDLAGNVYIADNGTYSIRKVDSSGHISTIAGGNGSGSSGDGGPALAAKITPVAIVSDGAGNLYVGDSSSQTVRKIDTQGNITRYAGGGTPSSGNGDGGPATSASLHVAALALDTSGNLYIADNVGYVVRKVGANGTISTFAGTGVYGTAGNGGPATSAQLRGASGVAVDAAGNVYIVDGGSYTIRKVDTSGIITVFAGTLNTSGAYPLLDGIPADQTYLESPRSIAVSPDGEQLYFADPSLNLAYNIPLHPEHFPQTRLGNTSQAQRLILENYGTANINISAITFSGDFAAAATYLPQANPCRTSIPVYTGFNGYCTLDVVFKPTAEGIRSFPVTITDNDTNGSVSTTLSSTGLGSALAMTSGMMYIVAGTHATTIVNRGDGGPATKADLQTPTGLVVDSSGNIYFSEYGFCQVRRVDGNTGIISTIAGDDPTNNCQYEAASNDGGLATQAHTPFVSNLTLDKNNHLYLAEVRDSRIRRIDLSTGIITAFAGNGGGAAYNIACGYSGDGGPATAAQLCAPTGMAFDAAGNFVFVDGGNNVIRKVNTAGIISTIAGVQSATGSYSGDGGPASAAHFDSAQGLAINAAGDIFISDTNNHVIRKIDHATGIINVYAGKPGVTGYSGDGGLATQATLNYPKGIAVDAAGNLFIADYYNMVVRKVDPSGIITTVAGNNTLYDNFNGDALPATATDLAFPNLVAVSPSGYIFISDGSNLVIREMTANGSLIFPPEPISTTSPAQTVTISNVGNMPMHFDTQYPTGITGDFAIASGGTCNFTSPLAVGASCTVNLTFTPTSSGVRTGVFGVFDDGVASPQYVALSGTGTGQPKQQQTITFSRIPDHVYGDASFTLSATASSGLPVTFSVLSGNATVSGSTVTITGIGTVTILANQAGDSTYAPAQVVSQSFSITRGKLTVTADDQTGLYGDAIVPLTYTITGFAYNDTVSVVGGTPALTTAATSTSSAGTYPIYVNPGTLTTTNYIFAGVDGTYTIKPARQTVSLAAIPDRVYGDAPFGVTASASSGLPVTIAITSGPATINGSTITITGVGTVTVTATQAGDTNHLSASAQRTFNVVKANTTTALGASPVQLNFGSGSALTATVTSATTGTPTGTVTFFDGATQLGTGTLANGVATFSVTSFAGGTHSLTASYGGDANFNSSTSSATRVIAGDYTLVANPSTVNIKQGSSGSTSITVTPTGGYKGTITLACANLPAEATCTFTPASVTADGSNTPLTMQLTIATTAPKIPGGSATVAEAGVLSGRGLNTVMRVVLILACLITFAWPSQRNRVRRLLLLLIMAGAFGLSGCGSAPTPVGGTPVGSVNIQISVANADAAHQLHLTVNVQ